MNDILRLRRLYNAVGRELRRILLAVEPSDYSEIRAEEIRGKARDVVRMLNVGVERWAATAIPKAYAKGERQARTALEILGKTPKRPPIEDRRRRLIDDLMVILIRANNSIPGTVDRYLAVSALAARTVATAQVQEFEYAQAAATIDELAETAVQYEQSRGVLSAKLKDFLRSFVEDDRFIQIGNRMYRMNKYADLVARTTLREAQTAATRDLCRQYENDLVQWSDHGTNCEICAQFEGQIYSLSGRHPTYPMLPEEPPAHPNCMHSLLPTSDIAIESEQMFGLYQQGRKPS